ncbi:MAG: tryptophan synthase subunit alpha [Deltaproteobacteria bacterium]|nr:tryptophan synthase subunit alpha [Deltaproteobacteria bacterium]
MKGLQRIDLAFTATKNRNEAALIAFLTAGHPDLAMTERLVLSLSEAGADLIELGIPFSDPLADGPVIQRSSQLALEKGFSIDSIPELVYRLRRKIVTPLLLMSYCNPILSQGLDRFLKTIAEVEVDGLIIPDLTLEESATLHKKCAENGLALVMLVAPTSPPERIEALAKATTGFLYTVSLKGVTGSRQTLPAGVIPFLRQVKKLSPQPVAIGFGLSKPEQVSEVSQIADGVVVGSAFVKLVDRYGRLSPMIVSTLAKRLKKATRR